MGQITVDQSHQVMATLAINTAWEEVDFKGSRLQDLVIRNPKEAGRQFTSFLLNGGRMMIGGQIISVNRDQPFDPVELLGRGWTIDEQDERSLSLAQVDLANVRLVRMLKKGEKQIKGEEKLERLKAANHIRLDARIFQTLWQNQAFIPEAWKEKTNGDTTYIFFDGTIFRNPRGDRGVLYLCWDDGQWRWDGHWLESGWRVDSPSAVLASI